MTGVIVPTSEEWSAHLRAGHDFQKGCLVCDEAPMSVGWTTLHNQAACRTCGMTYAVYGKCFNEDFLKDRGLSPDEVAKGTAYDYNMVPLFRVYWLENKRRLPLGTYWDQEGAYTRADAEAFVEWLKASAEWIRPLYPDDFVWDSILRHPSPERTR